VGFPIAKNLGKKGGIFGDLYSFLYEEENIKNNIKPLKKVPSSLPG
jgi:hypothetical protein